MIAVQEGPWRLGLNSVDSPAELPTGQYQWAVNCLNKGGAMSTRPGQASIPHQSFNLIHSRPRGIKMFTPRGGVPEIVIAAGGSVMTLKYPFSTGSAPFLQPDPTILAPLELGANSNVEFETTVLGVIEDADGNITSIDPYPVLIMSDGYRSAMYDGTTVRYLDPNPSGAHETPAATWMKWIGNRLWTAQGRKIRVSNLLNPIKFTEEDVLSEGGYFNLPDDCTGLGVTPDFRSLLAFTDSTTTSFQAGIINRSTWSSTPDFQKVIFSNIGCAAGRSIVNQYGMTWWYSHGGLINLDNALQTYRSSEIKFKDASMRRSRSNFSDDISGICATAFENFLLISVPSGDLHNYHTWVMDGNPTESVDSPAQWSSVWTGTRPIHYTSGVIDGKTRVFAFSDDYPATTDTSITSSNIWEIFLPDRRDIGSGIVAGADSAKNISCGFETRIIPLQQLSQVKHVELELEEIVGTAQIDIYYATRRGTYKRFGTKQVVGTVGSITAAMTLPVTFYQYLPQRRTIRSVNESLLSDDTNPVVETPQNRNIDKGFSFLIKWTGQLSISRMKVFFDEYPEQVDGTSESNETTDRYITPSGTGAVLSTGPTAIPISSQQSSFLPYNTPRWAEDIYQSLP